MLQITPNHLIFLAIKPIDFRRGIDGVAASCWRICQQNPMRGHFFIFRNRRGNAIKILVYDGQGYWLCHKRLSQGRFTYWPTATQATIRLSATQLQVLLANHNPTLVSN